MRTVYFLKFIPSDDDNDDDDDVADVDDSKSFLYSRRVDHEPEKSLLRICSATTIPLR